MTADRSKPSAVVIGAGMTGLLLAIRLRESGITDVTVLEKAQTLGGTWRENTYPGVACDVPSHAYTYSFEPNPDWSNHFPPGSEIQSYFHRVFDKYGLAECTRFNEPVTRCEYDAATARWHVSTAAGGHYEADLLFSATGLLHQPVYPDIDGLDSFAGAAFHSARWDHDVALEGKRIGVIGTGSSATQIVAALVDMPGTEVTVFQRTPQWIVRMDDRPFTEKEKARFRRQPFRMKLVRRISELYYYLGTVALTGDRWWHRQVHKLMSRNAHRFLEESVHDPELRAALTPDYQVGCKRVVINPKFYDAVQRPNCRLVTAPISRIEDAGPVTGDGERHALDILVMATGFDASAFTRPIEMIGRDGLDLETAWRDKQSAYRSLCIPGFPNFFMMLGPNSPIGNQSIIEIAEHQADYALQLMDAWRDGRLEVIEATPEALAHWREMIRERMRHTVWTSGCNSWYLDKDGDALSWPDSWRVWLKMMRAPRWDDFVS
jgi:cation diffusion facilitator CzcD-associated flavoprotein CzcO